jgi:DinB superfamily
MPEETIDQYKERILGYVKPSQEPLEILNSTVGRIEKALNGISPERLQEKKDGKWSAAEILAHYAEGEIVFGYRIRIVLSSNGIPIQAYDQNIFMQNAKYLVVRPDMALALLRNLRKTNVEFLKSLTTEQWDIYGIHSERGKESIRDIVRLYAGHDLNHLQQLERLQQ